MKKRDKKKQNKLQEITKKRALYEKARRQKIKDAKRLALEKQQPSPDTQS